YFRTHPRAEDPDPERGFVYQALSGCAVTSGPAAQKAGWRYFCERTSSHIVWSYEQSQREAEKWGLKPPLHTKTMIERERAEYDLADRIIVPSRFAQRTFLEMGLPADKIDIVPLIIRPPHTMPDVDPTQLDAVRDWSGPGPFRFLFVGPLGVRKGVGYLAQALRQADLPDWHLTMIGAPSRHTERLMRGSDPKRITKLGAQPHDRVLAEMQRAHCLILPSLDEGYGLVSAEAMSCRLPSVLTTACGVADIHRDGETGLIVPEADSDALARALSQMAWDRQATRQMGLAAFLAQNHAADPRTIGQSWIGRYLC
ncbi:MAG: glycosyltransferase family 4 protein, partial [Rhodospirillaceae bacterium]